MVAAEAQVLTPRASRYLVQLCRHVAQLHDRPRRHGGDPQGRHNVRAQVEWDETHGTLTLNGARCSMLATPDTLTLRVEAADNDHLQRVQRLVSHRLETISRRDGLRVVWQPVPPAASVNEAAPGGFPAADCAPRRTA